MSFFLGVVLSLLGAVAHSAIDLLRKLGAQRLQPADLVALVTLYDAVIAAAGVWCLEGGLPDLSFFPDWHTFCLVVLTTSSLAVTARLLYQRALSIAPLSLTVPYLAFTPAFVVLISPLFLVGEIPSPMGLLGVLVVSISGYLLGRVTASADASDQPSSPSKAKLPIKAAAAAAAAHHHRQHSWSGGASSSSNNIGGSTAAGQPQQQQQQQVQQHQQGGAAAQFLQEWREHNPAAAGAAGAVNGSKSSSSSKAGGHKAAWATAYYKNKSTSAGVCLELPAAPVQLIASALTIVPVMGSNGLISASSSSSSHHHHQQHDSASSNGNGTLSAAAMDAVMLSSGNSSSWDDSQSKQKEAKAMDGLHKAHHHHQHHSSGKPASAAAARALWPWQLGGGHAAAGSAGSSSSTRRRRLRRQLESWHRLLSGPKAGPALVLVVGFLYSLTASMDKLGVSSAPSIWVYFLGQRLAIGAAGLLYLLTCSRGALRQLVVAAPLLLGISLVEIAAVVLYLCAIQNLLVSYVVAIKRVNVLISTLIGCVLFKERVRQRIPYILVMLVGMLLIVLQPGHEDLHHSHHTRRLLVPGAAEAAAEAAVGAATAVAKTATTAARALL